MLEADCKKCTYFGDSGECRIDIRKEKIPFFPWDVLAFSFGGISLAPYVPTPCRVIRRMLFLGEVKTGDSVYDLGSGDGRIVMLAVGDFGAKAVGYEQQEDLVKKSLDKINTIHLNEKIKIIKDDLLNADLEKADVITMYLSPEGNKAVKPKLERELRSGTRVVSLEFEIQGWAVQSVDQIIDENLTYTIYVYRR
ncbi:MAG: SAM-dependent methyltransferase [Candidatus Bathyarchaeota archaeon]